MPVDGAPSLGGNPYVGAAAGAASAAVSLMNALDAAHRQQLRLQQQQQAQAAKDLLDQTMKRADLLQKGGKPYQPYIEQRDQSGMVHRTPNPDVSGMDQSRVMQFPSLGDQMSVYIPTPEEIEENKEKVKDKYEGKRTAPLKQSLADEYQGAGLDMKPGESYSTGMYGEANAAARDHHAKKGSHTINLKDFSDAQGNPVPVMIDDEGNVKPLNLQGGLQAQLAGASAAGSAAEAAGAPMAPTQDLFKTGINFSQTAPKVDKPSVGGLKFTPKEPTPKAAKSLHFERDVNDAGDVTTTAYDPETGKRVTSETRKGLGAKRKDPDAEAKPKPPSGAQLRQVEKTKADRIIKAKQDYRKALAEALPGDDTSTATENYREALQDAQNEYESSLGALTGNAIPHNSWADEYGQKSAQRAAGAQAAGSAAKAAAGPTPQQQQPQAKKYSASDITAWAKAHGKDPADAIKRAKAKGLI